MYPNFRIYFSTPILILSFSTPSQILPISPSCSHLPHLWLLSLYSLKGHKSVCPSFQRVDPELGLVKWSPANEELHVSEKNSCIILCKWNVSGNLLWWSMKLLLGRETELYVRHTTWMNLIFHERWRDTFQHQGYSRAKSQILNLMCEYSNLSHLGNVSPLSKTLLGNASRRGKHRCILGWGI